MNEQRDLRSVGQPGYEPFFWARLYGRRLSWPVTLLALRTPLSANAVSVISIVIGATGGLCLGANSLAWDIAAVALILLSWVLDCVDGEVARVRGTCSLNGEFIDACRHQIVAPAIFAGLALGVTARHPDSFWLLAMGFSSAVLSVRFTGGMVDQMVLEGVRRAIRRGRAHVAPASSMTSGAATSDHPSTCSQAACQARCEDVNPVNVRPYGGDGRRAAWTAIVRPFFVDFNILHILILAVAVEGFLVVMEPEFAVRCVASPFLQRLHPSFSQSRPSVFCLSGWFGWTPLDFVHIAYGVAFPIVKLGSMVAAWRRGVTGEVENVLRGGDTGIPHHE